MSTLFSLEEKMHFFSLGRSNVLKLSGGIFHDTSPSKNVFHRSGDEAVIFARCCAIHRQLKDKRENRGLTQGSFSPIFAKLKAI